MRTAEPLDRIVARFDAWYHGAVLDRPPVSILHVSREHMPSLPGKTHASRREAAFDVEYRVFRFAQLLDHHLFIGDTVPTFREALGADEAATLFGGELEFGDQSVWARHTMTDVREVLTQQPDFDNPYWTAIRRMTELSVQAGQGRWITSINLHDYAADTLVALVGPETLCLAIMDDPEGVRLACDHIAGFYGRMYDDLHDRIAVGGLPTGFEGELSYGKTNRMGCDFLCMLSPAMAAACVYPALATEVEHLDRCYFHLDSAGALPHLDWLFAQPKIRGIQWVYGANRGPASQWIPVYQRIQQAGRAIELLPVSVADALETMRHLRPEGVWVKMWALSEADAHGLVAEVGKRSNWAR